MIGEYIHPILLVTGAITCSMIAGVFAPGVVLKYCFLENRPSPAQMLMIQRWFLVVALIGSLIVYAAYQPAIRSTTLTVAIVEKFSIGVLLAANPARNWRLAGIATVDGIMGALYVGYFLGL